MTEPQTVQWFPGHMAKTRRQIEKSLALVDAAVELADARIPVSSRNPELAGMLANKPRILLLNKCDMADPAVTSQWLRAYQAQDLRALPVDCRSGKGLREWRGEISALLADRLAACRAKGMVGKPLRLLVVGIPNVGKSSFINRVCGGARAKVEDRPGVTRGNQWFRVDATLELLDTPGVLWPKFEDAVVGQHLAFTGAVTDRVVDVEWLALCLLETLSAHYMPLLTARYGVEPAAPDALLCEIGRRRGMVVRGGEVDTERAANMLLSEYRDGKLGAITLERP